MTVTADRPRTWRMSFSMTPLGVTCADHRPREVWA